MLSGLTTAFATVNYCKYNGMDKTQIFKRQNNLINALKHNNKTLFIQQTKFPLRINSGPYLHIKHLCLSKTDFSKYYDLIFTKNKRDDYLNKLKHDKTDPICRYNGAGLAGGDFWLTPDKHSLLYAINFDQLNPSIVNKLSVCKSLY